MEIKTPRLHLKTWDYTQNLVFLLLLEAKLIISSKMFRLNTETSRRQLQCNVFRPNSSQLASFKGSPEPISGFQLQMCFMIGGRNQPIRLSKR